MTTSRRFARASRRGSAVFLASAILLAGCDGGNDDDAATGTATSSQEPPATEVAATSAPEDAAVTTEPEAVTEGPEPAQLTASDDSFTVDQPQGWVDAVELLAQEDTSGDTQVVVAAKDRIVVDGFVTNVMVTRENEVDNLNEAMEAVAEAIAGDDGGYELLDPIEVDGAEAPGYQVIRTVGDQELHQTQRWIQHDGALYQVTFSSLAEHADDTEQILTELLETWTWQD